MDKINLAEESNNVKEYWSPNVISELNGQQVKVAKLLGEFHWHKHDHEDELFYVIEGELEMLFRDKSVFLSVGEMIMVPKGVEHKPVAAKEVTILLFEPASTVKNGD